jgi:hypothetical protein
MAKQIAAIAILTATMIGGAEATMASFQELFADADFDEIVFTTRQPGRDGHWYANFGYATYHPSHPGKLQLYSDGGKMHAPFSPSPRAASATRRSVMTARRFSSPTGKQASLIIISTRSTPTAPTFDN